jgi:hypothetical protein
MNATTTMVIMWISWTVWQHYGFSSVGAMLGGTIVAIIWDICRYAK